MPTTRSPGSAPTTTGWRRPSARQSRNSCRTARNTSVRAQHAAPLPFQETIIMWVLLVLVVIVGLWVVSAYNGLISLKNQTVNAFKQIDVQLKRRHDLIPNLINAVKGAMDFERSTLEAVIQARNQAVTLNASEPQALKQVSQAEDALFGPLLRML